MGCGVSKDCIADQSLTKSKKKLIHACREHLQHAIAISDKHAAASPHDYTHLRETPTVDEQGEADDAAIEEQEDPDNDNDNNASFPVHEEDDHINADEVIAITPDESEYLENRPPASQPLMLPHQSPHAQANSPSSVGAQKAVHKPPLRELSITSNGKLDEKKDHFGTFAIPTSSPRSHNYFGGISPSRPSAKAKSSPLQADKVKLISPFHAWNQNDTHSTNFVKAFADHQLCKEVEFAKNDALEVVGHSYNPIPVSKKTSEVQFDRSDQAEELFKSHTNATIDGFIEDLQNNSELENLEKKQQDAFDSNQLTSRLIAYGDLTGSPNSYMRELLEHFDKSTESLHMSTTPRTESWQSKLLETLDRDIDSILLEEQAGIRTFGKDRNSNTGDQHIDHTRYDSIEL